MSEESRTNSPSKDQKESYQYATSGQPCGQDTNPPAMPADKIDSHTRRVPSCDCKEDDVLPISQTKGNIMPGNEQQDYNDLPPLPTEHHPQPFSIPGGSKNLDVLIGQPVVVGSPNAEGQYLCSPGSTSTDISSFLELSAGSSQLSGSQPSVCKYI